MLRCLHLISCPDLGADLNYYGSAEKIAQEEGFKKHDWIWAGWQAFCSSCCSCMLPYSLLQVAKQNGRRAGCQRKKNRWEWTVSLGELPSLSSQLLGGFCRQLQTDYISILLTKLLAAVERTQLSREVGAIRLCICNTNYFRCFLIYECVMFLAAFYHRLSEWLGCVGMCFWLKSY